MTVAGGANDISSSSRKITKQVMLVQVARRFHCEGNTLIENVATQTSRIIERQMTEQPVRYNETRPGTTLPCIWRRAWQLTS